MKYTSFVSSVAVALFSVAGLAAPLAHAQTVPTIQFSYDPDAQVLTLSSGDGSVFTNFYGLDQLGDAYGGGNNSSSVQTPPGIIGDSVGSEWLLSADPAAGADPCGEPAQYTGDPETDFAACIAAIDADGGTYETGTFGTIQVPPGTQPDVTVDPSGDAPAFTLDAAGDAITSSVPDSQITQTGAEGHMNKTNGFEVVRGSVFTSNLSPTVPAEDGRFLQNLINEGIVKQVGGKKSSLYKLMTGPYTFPSPSLAADLVTGVPVNGWNTWVTGQNVTLGSLYKHQ